MTSELLPLRHLRGTFAAFVVTGVIVIFAVGSRIASSTDTSQHYFLIAMVVGLMCVYGLFLWIRNAAGLSTDADGETFYYLGFIFTLATLVATFMPLLWTDAKADSKQVLGLFGLGLITTFVGLAGRILYSRYSETGDDSEHALQRVATAAENAARSIEAVTLQIQRSGDELERSIGDGHGRLSKAIEQHAHRLTTQLTKQLEESSGQMAELVVAFKARSEDILRTLQEQLRSIQLPSKEAGVRLSTEIESTVQRLKGFSAGLNDSNAALSETKSQFVATSAAAGHTKKQFDELRAGAQSVAASMDSAAKSLEQSGQAIDGFNQSIGATTRALAEGQERISRTATTLTHELDQGRAAWKGFVDASGSLASEAQKLTAVSNTLLTAITAIANATGQAAEASRAFSDGASGLATAARTGSAVATDLSEKSKEAARLFNDLVVVIRDHHAQLQQLVGRLATDVETSREAVQKVHQNLVASASFILQKLS